MDVRMSKKPKKTLPKVPAKQRAVSSPQADFEGVLRLIDAAKGRALAAVNTALIELYWSIGQHISRKVGEEAWGQGTVESLAEAICQRHPTMGGFSARNLWR